MFETIDICEVQAHLSRLSKRVAEGKEFIISKNGQPAHARTAGLWSVDDKDPFDRMLAAQAQIEELTLVTSDKAFRAFEVETFWQCSTKHANEFCIWVRELETGATPVLRDWYS